MMHKALQDSGCLWDASKGKYVAFPRNRTNAQAHEKEIVVTALDEEVRQEEMIPKGSAERREEQEP